MQRFGCPSWFIAKKTEIAREVQDRMGPSQQADPRCLLLTLYCRQPWRLDVPLHRTAGQPSPRWTLRLGRHFMIDCSTQTKLEAHSHLTSLSNKATTCQIKAQLFQNLLLFPSMGQLRWGFVQCLTAGDRMEFHRFHSHRSGTLEVMDNLGDLRPFLSSIPSLCAAWPPPPEQGQ